MTEFGVSRVIERFVKFSFKPGCIVMLFVCGSLSLAAFMKSILSGPTLEDVYRLVFLAFASSFSLGLALAFVVNRMLHLDIKHILPRPRGKEYIEIFCDFRDSQRSRDALALFRSGFIIVSFLAAAFWVIEGRFWMTTDSSDFIETGFFPHIYPFLLALFFFVQGMALTYWHYKIERAKPYF